MRFVRSRHGDGTVVLCTRCNAVSPALWWAAQVWDWEHEHACDSGGPTDG